MISRPWRKALEELLALVKGVADGMSKKTVVLLWFGEGLHRMAVPYLAKIKLGLADRIGLVVFEGVKERETGRIERLGIPRRVG